MKELNKNLNSRSSFKFDLTSPMDWISKLSSSLSHRDNNITLNKNLDIIENISKYTERVQLMFFKQGMRYSQFSILVTILILVSLVVLYLIVSIMFCLQIKEYQVQLQEMREKEFNILMEQKIKDDEESRSEEDSELAPIPQIKSNLMFDNKGNEKDESKEDHRNHGNLQTVDIQPDELTARVQEKETRNQEDKVLPKNNQINSPSLANPFLKKNAINKRFKNSGHEHQPSTQNLILEQEVPIEIQNLDQTPRSEQVSIHLSEEEDGDIEANQTNRQARLTNNNKQQQITNTLSYSKPLEDESIQFQNVCYSPYDPPSASPQISSKKDTNQSDPSADSWFTQQPMQSPPPPDSLQSKKNAIDEEQKRIHISYIIEQNL